MPEATQSNQEAITCPKCASEDVTFSKKKQLYVCPDCHHEFTIEKKIPHRRIFLSYGHDEYAPLAEQLKKDLQNRGHEVWIDIEHLKPGVDWEDYIAEGLEWVSKIPKEGRFLLLMTPHSVRRPDGYCLNEIVRALERKLFPIPVMVKQCEPPLSICRIQWLDMQDCVPVRERTEKYKAKFARLLEALEEDRIDFEGVQMRLIQRLSPLHFDADILLHLKRFTGRQWVFDRIDAWLSDAKSSRVFWITGKPGVGKTAIAAWLCANRGEIAAFHLCRHGHVEKSNPQKAILSIAYQLSSQLPDYQERLNSLDLEKIITIESPRTIFDNLIVQPLTVIPEPNRNFAVLIDALDEATANGKNELASFIASEFDKTPDWLRLIITSRPEPEVMHPLQALTPYVLDASTPENEEDIRAFLKKELKTFTEGKEVEAYVIDKIFQKSEGIFLYVEYIRRELQEKRLSLNEVDIFPQGLGGIYAQFFERKFSDIDKFKKNYRPVLELIAAAREPLEVEYLASLFGWKIYDKKDMLDAFGSLFSVSNNRIQPFHKSIIDWLTDLSKAGNYFVSAEEGHKRLADQGWKEYQSGAGGMSSYSVIYLPAHISMLGRKDDLRKLLFDFSWIHTKLEVAEVNSLISDYNFISDDRTLSLVQSAIQLSAHILTQDKMQLQSQLYGRLMGQDAHEIKALLDQIMNWNKILWLRPLIPCLDPPGGPLICTLEGHIGSVNAVAILPDSKRAISASDDNTLKIWDLESGEIIHTLENYGSSINAVAVLPDGKRIVSASSDSTLKVWDIESEKCLLTLNGHTDHVWVVAVLPDRRCAISGSRDRTLKLWDLESGRVIHTLKCHTKVNEIAVLPDGKHIISALDDNTLELWDLESGKVLRTFDGHPDPVYSVAVLPDGRRAISGSRDRIKLWDLENGKVLRTFDGHTGLIHIVAVLPDGKYAISASSNDNNTLKVWDIESGKNLRTLEGHTGQVNAVAMLPDGKHVISASRDKTLKLWDIKGADVIHTFKGHIGRVNAVAVLPDSKRIISASWDNTIKIWNMENREVLQTLVSHTCPVNALAVQPDGKRFISVYSDNTLNIWDLELVEVIYTHNCSVDVVAMLPDGKRAISAFWGTINIWDLERGEVIHSFDTNHYGPVNAITALPDGKHAVSAYWDNNTLDILDLERGKVIRTLKGYSGLINSVAVLPNGKNIISVSLNVIEIWDLERGEVINKLKGHTDSVNAVAVLHDGKYIISASSDKTLKIWDIESGEVLVNFYGDSRIYSCTVSPDGDIIIAGDESGRVYFFRWERIGIISEHTQIAQPI